MGLTPILYPLPRCPPDLWEGIISYPTVFITLCTTVLMSIVIGAIILFRYNSVRVWSKKIRPPSISNTLWVIFYGCVGIRAILDCIRYGVPSKTIERYSLGLASASFVFHGLTSLLLCLALNHQRRYRSTTFTAAPVQGQPPATPDASTPLVPGKVSFWKKIGPWEISFAVLFVFYVVFLYLDFIHPGEDTQHIFWILFLVFWGLQRLPILGKKDGPTVPSKILLFFAVLLSVVNDLPLSAWAQLLTPKCFFGVFSGGPSSSAAVDIVYTVYIISLLFLFFFVRSEYHRNMEECIWSAVSQIQDTFDFRKF